MTALVYGATGRTGGMVARELAARGIAVVVAGREETRLRPLAAELGCSYRVAPLEGLASILGDGVEVLVNVAGPFELTVPLAARAAVEAGVHYVDLANEYAAVTALQAFAPQFEAIGRSAMPAAGFGTVATDLLADLLVNAITSVVRLELGMQIGGDGRSAGAAVSAARVLAGGGAQLVNGELVHVRLGSHARRHPQAPGLSLVPVALGDLAVTPMTTGVTTVSTGVAVPLPGWLTPVMLPLIRAVESCRAPASRPPTGEGDHVSRAWAQAFRPDGTAEWATLTAGEGYEFSARAAAVTATGLLRHGAKPGVVTAVGQFGSMLRAEFGSGIESSVGSLHVASK